MESYVGILRTKFDLFSKLISIEMFFQKISSFISLHLYTVIVPFVPSVPLLANLCLNYYVNIMCI